MGLAICYPVLVAGSIVFKPSIAIPSALFPPFALEFTAYYLMQRSAWPAIWALCTVCDVSVISMVTRLTTGAWPGMGYALTISLSSSLSCFGIIAAIICIRPEDRGGQPLAMRVPLLGLALALGALPGCLISSWMHAHVAHLPLIGSDIAIRVMSLVLSVVTICPLLFGLVRGFEEPIPAAGSRELALMGLTFSMLCLLYYAFTWPLDRFLELMLLAPPLLWVALRGSHRAVALACAVVACGVGVANAHGFGKFAALVSVGNWRGDLLSTQVFLLILCGQAVLINRIILEERALLKDSHRKQALLLAYGKALDQAEDSTRRAAARDLHDGVAQIIAGQGMILGAMRRCVTTSPLSEMLDQALAASHEAQSAVRATIEDLSPPEMERASPTQMLTWMADFFRMRYQFKVDWRLTGDEASAHRQSRLIFRIIRELLYNAFKHSKANEARVELALGLREIEITVSDQGIGFAQGAQARPDGKQHGLANIEERVAIAGGRVKTQSALGKGCSVKVRLPRGP